MTHILRLSVAGERWNVGVAQKVVFIYREKREGAFNILERFRTIAGASGK